MSFLYKIMFTEEKRMLRLYWNHLHNHPEQCGFTPKLHFYATLLVVVGAVCAALLGLKASISPYS
ncbi:hypothetical protein IIB51_02990 [Patescibacteria group bacterium]|nr:hypothetical protein [Patescibacteria group bacterium]